MKGIGVDLVDLNRLDLDNERLIKHILADEEYACFLKLKSDIRKREYLGGRFAAKEAYLKAYGQGIGGMKLRDIIILNKTSGQPYFANDDQALLSISHERDYAIAFVVVG